MKVEVATLNDANSLAALHTMCLAFPWSVDDMQLLLCDQEATVLCVRAEHNQAELLGYLAAKPVGEALELLNIAVHPTARRQGIASTLIVALKRLATYEVITLEVRESNEAALALYAQHGFRVLHRRPGYYADTGEAGLLLACKMLSV